MHFSRYLLFTFQVICYALFVPVLAEKMSVSRKTIGEYLKSLKDKGIIERIGSARNGYWKIN